MFASKMDEVFDLVLEIPCVGNGSHLEIRDLDVFLLNRPLIVFGHPL